MSGATLSVQSLSAFYGAAQVLFDVSLEVAPGEAVALLGRNGAGKSTTMRAILGLVKRRQGRIRFGDRDISSLPTHAIVNSGLGYVPEDRRIFSDLTTEENLEVGRRPQRPGAPFWTREKLYAIFPNLLELKTRAGAKMSGGEQQMLAIARTLMGNPSLLLLDEPSEGLSSSHRRTNGRSDPRNEARRPGIADQRAEPQFCATGHGKSLCHRERRRALFRNFRRIYRAS